MNFDPGSLLVAEHVKIQSKLNDQQSECGRVHRDSEGPPGSTAVEGSCCTSACACSARFKDLDMSSLCKSLMLEPAELESSLLMNARCWRAGVLPLFNSVSTGASTQTYLR